jgi:hypothetical protein
MLNLSQCHNRPTSHRTWIQSPKSESWLIIRQTFYGQPSAENVRPTEVADWPVSFNTSNNNNSYFARTKQLERLHVTDLDNCFTAVVCQIQFFCLYLILTKSLLLKRTKVCRQIIDVQCQVYLRSLNDEVERTHDGLLLTWVEITSCNCTGSQ